LAVAVDLLLASVEHGLARQSRLRIIGGVAGLMLIGLAAALGARAAPAADTIVIGAKPFSEQFILAELIATRLRPLGPVEVRKGLGSAVAFRALVAGDLDAYVDYSGTLATTVLKRDDDPPLDMLVRDLEAKTGVGVVGAMGFENAYVLAMRRSDAQRLGVRSIADLARVAGSLTFGADLEYLTRSEWRGVQRAYGLRFGRERTFEPTFMYRALDSGAAQVISAFSSDGRIAAQDLVVLADPKHANPRYDALLLVAPKHRSDPAFLAALRPLVNSIGVERMRAANLMVDRDIDKRSPAAAAAWLSDR
jgi:osmoprotectant transport system permease protein